jgi:hypothetical protein
LGLGAKGSSRLPDVLDHGIYIILFNIGKNLFREFGRIMRLDCCESAIVSAI